MPASQPDVRLAIVYSCHDGIKVRLVIGQPAAALQKAGLDSGTLTK